VSLILLVLMTSVTWNQAVAPLAIGAVAAWAWPVVIVFYLGRRAKARRDNQIQSEVERQVREQNR